MAKFSVQNAVSGSVTYGDPRGDGSTDLQFVRNTASQVASGYASLITGGFSNTASGDFSVVIGGSENVSSGQGAVTAGSNSTASGVNSLALGYDCQSIGDGSVTIGAGIIANQDLSIAIGAGIINNAPYSAIVNSQNSTNLSTAAGSVILGGSYAIAYLPNQLVTHSNGAFRTINEVGSMQVSEVLLFRQIPISISPTPVPLNLELTLDGNAPAILNELVMFGTDKMWHVTADTIITDTSAKTVMASKDIVSVKKTNNSVTAISIDNISKVGDSALTSGLNVGFIFGTGGVDVKVIVGGNTPIILSNTIYRATCKLNIVELKSHPF